jgi:hypothetical protein
MKNKVFCILVTGMMLLVLAGCQKTQQPRGPLGSDVKESGFLQDIYPLMKEGEKGKFLRVYLNPRVDAAAANSYDKILLDSVTIYYGADSNLKDVSQEQLKNLATVFGGTLGEELSKDYQIVNEPGPKTLRLQTAITDAHPTETGLKAVSFVPWGIPGLKFVVLKSKESATGKPVLSGDVTMEMKMSDSQTGEVFWAAIDRRVGGRLGGGWESWTDVERAFQFWAEKIRYGLCKKARQGTDCVAPKE